MKTLTVWDAVAGTQIGPTYSLPDDTQFRGLTNKPAALVAPEIVEMPWGITEATIRPVHGKQTLHLVGLGVEKDIVVPGDVYDWVVAWDYVPAPEAVKDMALELRFEDQFAQLDTTRWIPRDWDPNEPTTLDHNPRTLAHHVFADGTLMLSSRVEPGVEVGGVPLRTTSDLRSVKVTRHEPVDGVPVDDTIEPGRYPMVGHYEVRAQLGHSDWVDPRLVLTHGTTVVQINPTWLYCPSDWAVYSVTIEDVGATVEVTRRVNGAEESRWLLEAPTGGDGVDSDEWWQMEFRAHTEAPGGEPFDMLVDWVRIWA